MFNTLKNAGSTIINHLPIIGNGGSPAANVPPTEAAPIEESQVEEAGETKPTEEVAQSESNEEVSEAKPTEEASEAKPVEEEKVITEQPKEGEQVEKKAEEKVEEKPEEKAEEKAEEKKVEAKEEKSQ